VECPLSAQSSICLGNFSDDFCLQDGIVKFGFKAKLGKIVKAKWTMRRVKRGASKP